MQSFEELQTLRASTDGAVGELVLSRPDKLNAMSRRMLEELIAAARWFDDGTRVKAVVIRGEGRSFCAGADITAMGPPDGGGDEDSEAERREALDLGRRMADAIAGMRALTVAGIHGHCVGGGVVLSLACDLRVAADDAHFSIPEVDLGLPLTWSGIPRLVRELGPALTKDLVLTCRPLDADEAHATRLVNRVVPAGELESSVRAIADKLASQPAYSLTVTKEHVNAVAEEAGSTAAASLEAELLLGALRDQESLAAMARYMSARS
jgi:enoyl-CoA hydratase/carnithine racemase